MRSRSTRTLVVAIALLTFGPSWLSAQRTDPRLDDFKNEVLELVEARAKMVQEIVDMLYSFGELGMQEFETQRYLTGILEENGFDIELGTAGMPSA